MTTEQVSKSSRTKEPSATDHQEIEWQFDAGDLEPVERWLGQHDSGVYGKPVQKLVKPLKALQDDLGDHQDAVVTAAYFRELGTKTGEARVPRGVAFTMGVYAERCTREAKDLRSVVPDSKPYRTLTKGKKRNEFEKVLESRSEANVPRKGVR